MPEEWRDVKGFECWYQVSNTGAVKSVERRILDGRIIKGKEINPFYDKDGYKKVSLSRGGKHYKKFVHRLVAEAFIPNPNNYPVINHIDENHENNDVSNLEWCTVQYNVNYGNRAKKYADKTHGELHYIHKLTDEDVKNIRKEYRRGVRGHGTESLGVKYGVHRMTVKAILTGRTWKHIKEVE